MADPTSYVQTQTTIPDYAKAYVEQMLGAGAGQVYKYDSSGKITGLQPYEPYEGERTAQQSDLQLQAAQGAGQLGAAPQLGAATNLATNAGLLALQRSQYTPSDLQRFQMEAPDQVSAMGDYSTPVFEGAQTDYRPEMYAYQMNPAERVGYDSITEQGKMDQYMSPYMQSVVDIQQREAQRQADIATTGRHSQQVQQGAYGGSRGAIMDAEAARNLALQKGDIQAQGLQAAYGQGMSQFNTEQQRQQAAQQANQQANLSVGQQNLASQLGVQQQGAQMGMQANLANLSNVQQAQVANQAAKLQMQGLSAQQAMQAALANQQANMNVSSQNLQSANAAQQLGEQASQYGAGLGLQGLNTALQGAGTLGQLGQTQFGQETAITDAQMKAGQMQQGQEQRGLDLQYQQYQDSLNYPYKQLGFMSDLYRGLPLSQSSMSQYQNPSGLSQAVGAGTAAYGAYKVFGSAKGGRIRDSDGLDALGIYNVMSKRR